MELNTAIARYNKLNKADYDVIGFTRHNMVCYSIIDKMPIELCKLERSSSSHGSKPTIRLKVSIYKMLQYGINQLCTIEEFDNALSEVEAIAGCKCNKGHILEYMLCKANNEVWHYNSDSFKDAPDIIINGVGYQCKYDGATICKLAQLED